MESWECRERREELRRWLALFAETVEKKARLGADYITLADVWVLKDLLRSIEATMRRIRNVCPPDDA